MIALHPYQVAGAEWLAGRTAALLADDMGLGKSAQAIAACDALNALEVVVICPASVVENWRREFAKFSSQPRLLLVLSYDSATDPKKWGRLMDDVGFDILIIDEAHMLKSREAKRTQAMYGPKCDGVGGLISKADRVFLLTGTPMPNHPGELWTTLSALASGALASKAGPRPLGYEQFQKKFCVVIDGEHGPTVKGGKNHDELKARLQPFMLRRLKSEVLTDLPPITWGELFVEGKIDAPKSYGYAHPKAQDALDFQVQLDLVAKALDQKGVDGLREIAPHVATLRRLTGLAKVAPVVEWVREWLESTDRKIVLFAHHRDVCDALIDAFQEAMFITGENSQGARQAAVDAFQRDPAFRVFIGQIQAAGVGITLTAASDLLFVESSWVPAENSQAAMRIHRIGQVNPCLIRFATLAGSIDEQIQAAVARKTADITKILG